MYQKDWRKWCRLCGKRNGADLEITLKIENTEILAVAIFKYFGILISEENSCCTKICIMCHDTINSIIKFNAHAAKVNEMFLDLESNQLNQNINVETVREKYGLTDENNSVYDTEMETVNFCSVELKTDSQSKIDNKDGNASVKCFLKTEMVEVDEISYSVDPNSFEDEGGDNLSNEHNINKQNISENLDIRETEENKCAENSDETILSHSVEKQEEKCFECNICHKRFGTNRGRTIHLKQKHSISIKPPTFKCNVCGKIFKNIHHLNSHKVVHLSECERKFYDCPQCSKKFTREWYVQNHIRVVHKRDRPFICELCGAAFGSNRNLADHLLTHSEEKNFKCPKCEKTFRCKRDLKLHVDIHDDTEYMCQVCGLKLNTKRILRRHMIVHTDLNKYKCNFCSKQFKRPDAFKNHLILHTGLKPYECSFCELTFANGSNCRKHQRTAHPIELAAAELKGKQKHAKNVPSIKQLKAVNEEALISKNMS